MMMILVEHGADTNTIYANGKSILSCVLETKNYAKFIYLIKHTDISLLYLKNSGGKSPEDNYKTIFTPNLNKHIERRIKERKQELL